MNNLKKPNLLVLGAAGGVSNAFLHQVLHHRTLFGKLVLLDPKKTVIHDPYLDHKTLNYIFLQKRVAVSKKEKEYMNILKKYNIDIVLDLTDAPSIPLLEATDRQGVSYVNTAMNDNVQTVSNLIFDVYKRRKQLNGAPHILCTGMNPGAVNMFVRYGIEKFGVPEAITHFEYDMSHIAEKWMPMMTWSIKEFLVETSKDPGGVMQGRGKVKFLYPNALENRRDMKPIISPIMKLSKYPHGFIVLHEENVTVAQKYNIPSRFIYAVNMQTMANLIHIYEKKNKVHMRDLILGDNTNRVLDGADNIGVLLEYKTKKVYYFNAISNLAVVGTNATYTQVAIGIWAALLTLIFDQLKSQVYFVEDLYETHYPYYLFDNLRVQEFVFKGKKLKRYNPWLKMKRHEKFRHVYI
ncbi:MAG TPA: saccharopine dehydrogenase NADP-binding domain-containing protein [Candidatus Nanoarchaeia archaeon]|nr:saccharopine dehydrogenase NADP-binding domain-containing protein [Candidatus Nanoarchaeia archaeon]